MERLFMPQTERTLSDQAVQILVVWSPNSQISTADIIDRLIVNHEAAVGMLKSCMSCKDGVVGLNYRGSDLRSGIDAELQLALLAVIDWETLHEKSAEPGSSSSTERVEYQETLETRAIIGNMTDLVQHLVDQLLAHSVVPTGVIVWCVFLARDHLLRVEEIPVGTGANFVNNIGLEVAVNSTGNVFAIA